MTLKPLVLTREAHQQLQFLRAQVWVVNPPHTEAQPWLPRRDEALRVLREIQAREWPT